MRKQFKRSQKCLGIGQKHFMFVEMTESFHHLLKMILKITFPRVVAYPETLADDMDGGSLEAFTCERKGKRFKNRERPGPF